MNENYGMLSSEARDFYERWADSLPDTQPEWVRLDLATQEAWFEVVRLAWRIERDRRALTRNTRPYPGPSR